MQCLSCKQERGTKFVTGVLLCSTCAPLAEKAVIDFDRELERVRQMTHVWLQQHIMSGGLINDGPVKAEEHAARLLQGKVEVYEVRSDPRDRTVARPPTSHG